MNLTLTDEQEAVREMFRAFAEQEIRPQAEDLDRNPRFPREIFLKAGKLGFFGMRYPEPEGGGADTVAYVLAVEELAWGDLATAAALCMQSLMGTYFVHSHARGKLRERLLQPALRGEIVGTICMTEPDAGSDLGAITTRAIVCGDRFLLSGRKTWITSAPVADIFTVIARTSEKGLSVFLVERGAEGLEVGKEIGKLGVRASITSEVSFDNTPATCLLGELDQGLAYLRQILAEIRVMTAALAVGIARAAHEAAVAYAAERQQFGRTINRFQAVQAHLAENAVDLEAARQLTRWAAWRSDQGFENAHEAAMAKLFASEAAQRICDRASRVLASYGYADDYPVQRYLRDVRFTLIGGGTSEILRINIAKGLYS
jgi:alkylation response protein AidB-like acyl-CoA dehydrogenase